MRTPTITRKRLIKALVAHHKWQDGDPEKRRSSLEAYPSIEAAYASLVDCLMTRIRRTVARKK